MMQDEERLRRLLGDEIGSQAAISDSVWEFLRAEGHIEAVESGSRDVPWLAERVANFLQATGRTPRAQQKREPMLSPSTRAGDHMMVLSNLLAKEANEHDGVKRFRSEVLGGRLLKQEEVESWVRSREPKGKSGEGMYLTIESPGGLDFETPFKLRTPIIVTETIGGGWHFLDYAVPGSQWVSRVGTPATRGELARLRFLSEDLAKRYNWQPAQATLFVLTNTTPLIPSFRWSGNQWPPPRRITLDVDLILSPRELAARYASVRRMMRPDKARRRELSQKHMTLAFFISERADGEPWAKRLRAWNVKYPKWKYGRESNFRRDAGRAIDRVLAPIATEEGVFRAAQAAEEKESRERT